MSAIAAILRPPGSDESTTPALSAMLACLRVYGEGSTCTVAGGALGACSRVPEPRSRSHPLHHEARLEIAIAFDGRLDDRDSLRRALGEEAPPATASDAALVIAAFARWREEAFARLCGPFALILFAARERRIHLARDPLGDRGLVYALQAGTLLAATEECALLAHPGVDDALDETTLARHFALLPPAEGATFFRAVHAVPAGRWLRFGPEGRAEGSTGSLQACDTTGAREEDLVDELRMRLREAVRCRLDPEIPPAILMSGGIDSTSVAATAADLVTQGVIPGPVRSLAWVFPETARADERRFQEPVVEKLRLESHWIRGDAREGWPDPQTWPVNPNTPADIPLRPLHESAYRAAHAAGIHGLLTGEFGDHLWVGGSDWLASLLAQGRPIAALRGLAAHVWHQGLLREPTAVPLRLALSRLTPSAGRPGTAGLAARSWLTPEARRIVSDSLDAAGNEDRSPRLAALLDPSIPEGRRAERRWAARHGIELLAPFRDRRLLELALGLPAHLLHRPGWSKLALRRAMLDRLPEVTRRRRWLSTQYPVIQRELAQRHAPACRALLTSPGALSENYVERRFIASAFPGNFAEGGGAQEASVSWRCLAAEIWRRRPLAGAARPE